MYYVYGCMQKIFLELWRLKKNCVASISFEVAYFPFFKICTPPGEEVPGSIPAVAARSLLVGSVSV